MNTMMVLAQAADVDEGIAKWFIFTMIFLAFIGMLMLAYGGWQISQGTGANGWLFIAGGAILFISPLVTLFFVNTVSSKAKDSLPKLNGQIQYESPHHKNMGVGHNIFYRV